MYVLGSSRVLGKTKGRGKKESHPVEPYLEDEDLEKELSEGI